MTEYFTVKRIDNSRLLRSTPPVKLRALWRRTATLVAVAACLLFYAWQHFECIQIRYQVEQLESQRAQANELNQQLQLEVATLDSPMRVDAIARNQLGMTIPVPGQLEPADGGSETVQPVLAEARTAAPPPQP
jgi:cell division protein FtsL